MSTDSSTFNALPEQRRSHEVYKPLKLDPEQEVIRLLKLLPGRPADKICCQLVTAQLRRGLHYEAASYTWGSPDDSYLIQINDDYHQFPVRSNLLELLVHLRYPDQPRTLWIDAICIDQDNLAERNQQVSMMRKIYSMAAQVVMWLGLGSSKTGPAIKFINDMTGGEDSPVFPDFVADALLDLCRLDYWTRTWIIQEVVVARDITIYCGSRALAWRTFVWALNIAVDRLEGGKVDNILEPALDNSYRVRRLLKHRNEHLSYQIITLEEALYRYRDSGCTDFRDKIFGLLGIVQDLGIQIDYSMDRKSLFFQVITFCHSSNPVRLGAILKDALKISPNDLKSQAVGFKKDQEYSTSPHQMITASMFFYGTLAECLHRNEQGLLSPTLWLCDPDSRTLQGFRQPREPYLPELWGFWELRRPYERFWTGKLTAKPNLLGADSGPEPKVRDLVFDFEGTNLAFIFRASCPNPFEVAVARIPLRESMLHLVECIDVIAGWPDLDLRSFEPIHVSQPVQVTLTWALLLDLVHIAEPDKSNTVSCCQAHVRKSTEADFGLDNLPWDVHFRCQSRPISRTATKADSCTTSPSKG